MAPLSWLHFHDGWDNNIIDEAILKDNTRLPSTNTWFVKQRTVMNQKAIAVQDAWNHQASYNEGYSCAFQMLMIPTSKWDVEVMLYYISSRETEARSQMAHLAPEYSIWKGKKWWIWLWIKYILVYMN